MEPRKEKITRLTEADNYKITAKMLNWFIISTFYHDFDGRKLSYLIFISKILRNDVRLRKAYVDGYLTSHAFQEILPIQ